MSFENKVAVVTGAASGIGYAISKMLIENGATVVGFDLNQELLQQREQELATEKDTAGKFIGVQVDVASEQSVQAGIELIVQKFKTLDFAFNVAGAARLSRIIDLKVEDWSFTIDICLRGMFICMKHEARIMNKDGAIVNITSLNSHVPLYGGSAYASAKAGAEMLTKNAAIEFMELGIRVNAILPGLVETPINKDLRDNPKLLAAYLERIPMRKAALPEDIAKPSLFLASDAASYITGASLLVDGGWAISGYPEMKDYI